MIYKFVIEHFLLLLTFLSQGCQFEALFVSCVSLWTCERKRNSKHQSEAEGRSWLIHKANWLRIQGSQAETRRGWHTKHSGWSLSLSFTFRWILTSRLTLGWGGESSPSFLCISIRIIKELQLLISTYTNLLKHHIVCIN